jgi:hypothetical protein
MQTITLGSLALNTDPFRLLAIDFNAPPTEIHEVTSALADKNIQADVRTSAYRDIVVSVAVTSSTKQTLISRLRDLSLEIAKPSNTLTVLPDGYTKAVTFAIGRNPEPEIPYDQAFESGLVAHVTFVLKAEPYAYRDTYPADTVWASALAPLLVSPLNWGDRPAPFGVKVDSGSTPLDALYLAVADSNAIIDWYYRECAVAAPFTWESTFFAATSDATAWGTTAVRYDPTSTDSRGCVWAMAEDLPTGRYRLLMRARVDSGCTATIDICDRILISGSTTVDWNAMRSTTPAASKRISNTSYTLLDFGEVDVPLRSLRSGGSGALGILISLTDASKYAYLDAMMLVPTDSLVRYRAPSGTSMLRYFELCEDGSTFVDEVATFDGVSGRALKLEAGVTQPAKMLAIANPVTPSATRPSLTLTTRHLPRYVLWRP